MMEKRGAGTSRGRENWGSPISASSAWRLERRRGRSELPFAWPPAGHGRQATSSPDILQEDGVGIFRNLPERELRRLKILLDHGSDLRQRRDGPLMFGLGFGVGTGVIVDRVDQVLYLGGTTKAKRPQLLQIVSQIEPRQRLVHTVDHEVEGEVRSHDDANRIAIGHLRNRGYIFAGKALDDRPVDALHLYDVIARFVALRLGAQLLVRLALQQ